MPQPYSYATADRTTPLTGDGSNVRYEAAPPPSADRTPQVSTEMNRLLGLVDLAAANGKLLEELKSRLAPVLRPHPMGGDPRADGGNGACTLKQSEPLAPLAGDLRDLRERLGERLHESNTVLRWLLDALGV
jgi:hypothetical protein